MPKITKFDSPSQMLKNPQIWTMLANIDWNHKQLNEIHVLTEFYPKPIIVAKFIAFAKYSNFVLEIPEICEIWGGSSAVKAVKSEIFIQKWTKSTKSCKIGKY